MIADAAAAPTAPTVRLEDYRPTDWLIDTVDLLVRLHPTRTLVTATLALRPNPAGRAGAPLVLDGDELELAGVAVDGFALPEGAWSATSQRLEIAAPPPGGFALTIDTVVNPSANTKLMGLYRSSGAYCTQCEAEGFRRITYFLDRPDVMSVYTTRIEADQVDCPVLLGNGNPVESGRLEGGRHYAVWHDPHPKPAYLFALVAGDLGRVAGSFTTRSGRQVELGIYVEPGKENRAGYAMDALIRSIEWDERVWGCEYDLDVFNIVAVSDFNMGAMENKGLNIFNDKYVLATPETATDIDYAHIEAIIAHEYFHNWTGNRITCRDWFQLCLKEGLTVYRDHEFSADMRSRPVKRIAEVRGLRAQQFAEDSGPLAHPVRPDTYREINNFYTSTVYEKGSELIRMLRSLIGDEAFRTGMALYFDRCDGTAATVEDFLACFAQTSGRNLDDFSLWYRQAGTPTLKVRAHYDADAGTCRLDFAQATPPTPGQPSKSPVVIPVLMGLVDPETGDLPLVVEGCGELKDGLFVLTEATGSLTFTGLSRRPVPSLLRGFSAPVKLDMPMSRDDLLTLFRRDSDPFNRWEAAQTFATQLLVDAVASHRAGREPSFDPLYPQALAELLKASDDHAFVAQVMTLPSESDLAREIGADIDPDAIVAARRSLRAFVGTQVGDVLVAEWRRLSSGTSYAPDAAGSGRRALRNAVLDLATAGNAVQGAALCREQFDKADNMTERFGALVAAAQAPGEAREAMLRDFEAMYGDDPLVLDKWFALQASIPEPATLDRVKALLDHEGFSLANPNRTRALVGTFAMANLSQFNRADGAGHAFVADVVLRLDAQNPQVAARILGAFRTWRSLEPIRRASAEKALRRIASGTELSPDVGDIVSRSLA